jgi:hypothetical protein
VPSGRRGRGQRAEPREPDREPEAGPEADGPAPRLQRKAGGKTPEQARLRAGLARTVQPADDGRARGNPRKTIEKGSRVRVLEGPFSGKVGVVQEVDGKGGARVMLGLLAVRVDVRDLARCAEGRNRPVLSTSHRKRVPVRS